MPLRGLLFGVTLLGSVLGAVLAVCGADGGRDRLRESRRGEALEHRIRIFTRLEEAKERLAVEVAEGRMSLREAGLEVERVQESLDDGYDDVLGPAVVQHGEDACRNLLTWVRLALEDDPERAGRILPRLDEELRREFPPR